MPGYENEGAQRSGHIPGAKSIPWAQAVKEDGTFKSAEDLRDLYGGKGVLSGEPIIAYCRIGERSAHTWFVLHELLGEADVKNYDGSWTEWGNLVNVPIERGLRAPSAAASVAAPRLSQRPDPIEQVGQDSGRCSPDQVIADQVGVGADRDAAADQTPARVSGQQLATAAARAPRSTSRTLGVHVRPGSISPTNGYTAYPVTIVGVGWSAPTISTASAGRPISSCASRSAVAHRSRSPSS